MAQFNTDIVVRTLGRLDPSFTKVITKIEQVSELVNKLNKEPLNIFGKSAGVGGDIAAKQLKGFQDSIRNVANSADNAVLRTKLLGNTVATTAEKAQVFAQALDNVRLKSGGLGRQEAAVKNLARAWGVATEQATTYSKRLDRVQNDVLRERAGLQPQDQRDIEVEKRRQAINNSRLAEERVTEEKRKQAQLDERALRTEGKIKQALDARVRSQRQRKESLQLGVGFPLLFGGGPGSVAGGAFGALSDTGGGFGGQVLFSAIGTQIDEAVKRARDFGRAIQDIDARALNDALGNVSSQLVIQVDLLKEQGKLVQARALLEEEVAKKTGLAGGASQNIANSVGILESGFKELVNAASGLLGIIGAPFAAAIGGILSLLGKTVALINTLLSGVGKIAERAGRIAIEFLFGKDAADKLDDAIARMNERLDDSVIAASKLGRELAQSAKDLSAEVVLEGTRSPYDDLAGKIANIRIDAMKEFKQIDDEYQNKLKEVNQMPQDTVEERVTANQAKIDLDTIKKSKELLTQQKFEQKIQEAQTKDLKDQSRELEKQAATLRKIEDARIAADLAFRVNDLQLKPDSKPFSRDLSPEELEVNKLQIQRAQNEAAIAKIRNSNLNITEQELRLAEQAEKNQLKITQIESEATIAIRNRAEAQQELREGAKLDLDVAQAKTDRAKFLLGLDNEILQLERSKLDLTEDQIKAYKDLKIATFEALNPSPLEAYMNQLEKTLFGVDAVEKQIVQMSQVVAAELASGLSNALVGLVDGTKTVEEAFGEMFANIGKAFIQMATEMLAQQALFALLKAFGVNPTPMNTGVPLNGRASGGAVTSDRPYMVGETGPELFIPQTSGRVMNNSDTMDRYSYQDNSPAVASRPIDVQYNVTEINGMRFVTEDQLQRASAAAAKQGAKSGETRVMSSLRNSRSRRKSLGI